MLSVSTAGIAGIGCDENPGIVTPRPDTTLTEGVTGGSMYRYHCSACHGISGQPLVDASEDLRDYTESFQTFDSILSAGPGLMPRFAYLSSDQRQMIYNHTTTLRR